MKPLVGAALLALLPCSTVFAQEDCGLFAAAFAASDVRAPHILIVDSLTMGVPMFAFHAVSRFKQGDQQLADTAAPRLAELNRVRKPLPLCVSAELGFRTVSDSTLLSRFSRTGPRWDGWEGVGGFALISQPVMSPDGMTALIYVGRASGNLAGNGKIYRLRKSSDGTWVKEAEAAIWAS